ncbi:MAG: MBL fold metallo-hydrolase [Planctomycetota bacterium]
MPGEGSGGSFSGTRETIGGTMVFKQISVGSMRNFNYLIGDEGTQEAAIVDPAFEEEKLYAAAETNGLTITAILQTHTHADHVEATRRVVERIDPRIYVHANEKHAIWKNSAKIHAVGEGDTIRVGDLTVKVFFTPGHTPGGLTFQVENKLITGDVLFVEGCGRVDLPGGDIETMWNTLQKLKRMDEGLEVYPGHDYGSMPHSTLKHEKEHNPYLTASKEEFYKIR